MFSLQIYLCGFSGRKLDKLRRLINSGGGVRFNQLNEDVTHVIVGDYDDDVRQFWSKSSHRSCQSSAQSTWYRDGLG
jgi:topoisomerase (DNA) II binding protein 1